MNTMKHEHIPAIQYDNEDNMLLVKKNMYILSSFSLILTTVCIVF